MAKVSEYKLVWVESAIGQAWKIEDGWDVVSVVLYAQMGRLLVLVRGTEK